MSDLNRQMAELSRRIAELEARLGEVAGEHTELTHAMAPFLARYRKEILPYQEELNNVRREIADLKVILGDQGAKRSRGAERLTSFLPEDYVPVQEQYERVWKGKGSPRPQDPRDPDMPPASLSLKRLYGEVVARVHPDLADTPIERARRRRLMERVEEAYLRRDKRSLEAMADAHRERSNLLAIVDEKAVKELEDRVFLLEELIHRLEGESFELRYGDIAKVKARADQASAEGRDLLRELSAELQRDLRQAQEELAGLRALL